MRSPCSLPEDIYYEILTRLDLKSLSRLKLVSKEWYMFLSEPLFSRLFSERRLSITGFFYRASNTYQEKLQYIPIDANEEPIIDPPSCLGFLDSPAILYNSCNGLLHWSCESDHQSHFISNPLTHKFIALPWPTHHPNKSFASGIAFNPSLSHHFQVIVFMVQSRFSLKSKTFSSETMQWDGGKENLAIPVLVTRNAPFCPNRGVFLNGFLYWELKSNSLLSYNVEDQSITLIKLPLRNESAREAVSLEPGCLGESRGILHYCRVMDTKLCVWVATQNTTSSTETRTNWVQHHLVNLSDLLMCQNPSIRPYGSQALAFLQDCEGVLLGVEGKIISCCLNADTVNEVCKVRRNGDRSDCVHPSMFFPFVHTLALSNFPSKEKP